MVTALGTTDVRAATDGGAGTIVAGPTPVYPGVGNMVYPTVSATYPAASGGVVTAEATWQGTASLELAISCPGGLSTTRSGPSGLSVSLDDSGPSAGTCQVTLSLPPGVTATVSYTLSITPRPSA